MTPYLSPQTVADGVMQALEKMITSVESLGAGGHELLCKLYEAHDEAWLLQARFTDNEPPEGEQ